MGWGSQQQVAIMRQLKWRRCPPPVKQVKLEAEIKVENVGEKKKKKNESRERERGGRSRFGRWREPLRGEV